MLSSDIHTPTPHPNTDHRISPWIDEQIWGHRLWDSQSSWLLFLEFLTVAEGCHREGRLLDDSGRSYPLLFKPYKRLALRNILFNNEILARIAKETPHNNLAWQRWLDWMNAQAQGVHRRDFSYLKERFESFHEFSILVSMIRSATVENERNKRWSSRFVFPFGPNAIYEDLNIRGTKASREYINFGRSGELLYLMLNRSKRRDELAPHLAFMFKGDNPWDKLLGLMQPGPDQDLQVRGQSYLPYLSHQSFDALAEDWLAIFSLNLPDFDAYSHLATLGALHLQLYQLWVAADWVGCEQRPYMICEIVAPKKTFVRELSWGNYIENNALSSRAIKARIKQIEESVDWQQAKAGPNAFLKCRQILMDQVWWGSEQSYEGPSDPDIMISELRRVALKRHQGHVANVHRSYGRNIGLVSRRGTNRLRYAPNDTLITTLLFANVEKRMELKEFLDTLFDRYGLIIGDREAEKVLPKDKFDKKAFRANVRRFEQRLGSLGLIRRLSDSCAYVANRYSKTA